MNTSELLESYLERKKAAQSGYSMRAFARDLGVSPAFVSLVLKGKKKLPIRLLGRTVKVLDLDLESAHALKNSCLPEGLAEGLINGYSFPEEGESVPAMSWAIQDKRKLKALRHWFYVAILDFTTCDDYDGSVTTIAFRLGLSVPTVEVALRELLGLGLLVEKDGKLVKSTLDIRLASSQSQADIRRFHSQLLDKAKEELATKTSDEDFSRRLITGITIAANPEKIEIAKKMLSDCLHEIAALTKDGSATEVYHLAAQFFPLTHRRES